MPTNNYTWVLLSISFQESKSHREMLSHTHILALLCSLLSAVHSPLHCCSSGAVPSVALAPFCTMRGNTGIHLVTLRCVNWHGTNTSHPLCKWCRWRWHLGSGCELWYMLPDGPTIYIYISVPFFLISVSGRAPLPHPTVLPIFYIPIFFCDGEVWLQQLSSLVQSVLISPLSAVWAVVCSFGTA